MPGSGSAALSARLALASFGTVVAVGVVCAVGLSSLGDASAVSRVAVSQQLAIVEDAVAMSAFQNHKGFVAEYLLTGDRRWLSELDTGRPAFASWLAAAHAKVADQPSRAVLDDIQREYAAYDQARKDAVAAFDAGHPAEAQALMVSNRVRSDHLRDLFQQLSRLVRQHAEATMRHSEASVRRLARLLVGTSIAGVVASVLVGFWWARRITRPIYELQVLVESAAERTRLHVQPGRAGLESLGDQVEALVTKLEETDAALAEHRRRLVQSDKLSAVGELAAKLAHEVLNPLAGMKAAVQVLARQGAAAAGGAAVVGTAEALNREITRVESLIRRLVNYARPLSPRVELVAVETLLASAVEAAQPALDRHHATVDCRVSPGLPPVEVDPLLLTQALVNVLVNAAEAMAPAGGHIDLSAAHGVALGRDHLIVRARDEGPGFPSAQAGELFKPFFTTKPEGHGLGLAVSQNILMEHAGRIVAQLPDVGRGAIFELQLPLLR